MMDGQTAKGKKPRLLLSAYAFSPYLGSEFAQGWNYARVLCLSYDITVLVGSSDGAMGDVKFLESYLDTHHLPYQVVFVPPTKLNKLINILDNRYGLSWMFVWSLDIWHRQSLQRARYLHDKNPFDLVHQLGPVGFRNPGYLYKLGVPSYWGPVGGFQYINLKMAFKSSKMYFFTSAIRNVLTYFNARSSKVKDAISGFTTMSFATKTNLESFASVYSVEGPVLSDQACLENISSFVNENSTKTNCQ
jgi:hypothetical protein